jgi:mRNA interferase MazF
MIRQGEIYWLDLGSPAGSEPGLRRPFLVVQNDLFNESALNTTVVVALTTNLRRASLPGNVRLERGEAGLSEPSVVNMTQISTVNKSDLETPLGRISEAHLRQVLEGIHLVFDPI